MKEFASEVDKLEPGQAVSIVAGAVRGALDAEDFVDKAEERIARALDEVGDGSLGAWLEDAGLLEVWTTTTAELVSARLQAVVQTEAFEMWWSGLFET